MTARNAADTYTVDSAVPADSLDSLPVGTNLLFVGDGTRSATNLVYRILARSPTVGERVILVTTETNPGPLVERYQAMLRDAESLEHLFVVDASMSGLARDIGPLSPTHVEAASSPSDITGIGVGVTNHLRTMRTDRVRLGMVSLSPLLDTLGPERTFAFFHVLTSRIRRNGQLGLFTVDASRHDKAHVDILQSLTDGGFQFERVDGTARFRGFGAVDAVSEWTSLG